MARTRSEEANTKILAAATALLFSEGVPGFSIDEVARRSGVAKTTIYRHFPAKHSLLLASLDGAIEVPPTPDTGTLRGDLMAFLTSVLPTYADHRVRAVFYDFWSAGTRDPALDQMQRETMGRRAGPTFTIYERALERGEISTNIDYPTAVEIIEGPLIIRSLAWPETLDELNLGPLIDRMLVSFSP